MIDGNIDILSLQGDIVDTVSLEGNLLPIGPKGDKGDDGFSPVVTTSKSGKTTTIKFETATGNVYAYVQDGEDGQGSGDMLTDVYDQNKNGIVDNAEKVNNHTVLTDVPENAIFTDTTYTAGTGIDITNNVISNTNTNAIWGDITGTLSNQTDLQNALDLKANTSAIPTKVSDLTNDSGFIDKTVNNLTNYYTTANTYNKNEVNILIGQIQQFKIQVVQTLPVSDIDTHTIYLVPKTGSGNDVYNEYLYINNAWELIGDTTVDLSNYYTKSETDTLLGAKANSSDLATVATSGSYNDLSNKPTIPDELADLSDDSTHRLVSDTEKQTWNNKVDSTGDATTSSTNTSITLNNTLEAPIDLTLKGNTSQTGTPTPSSHIPVNVVSGDNDIVVCGKNFFNSHLEIGAFDTNGLPESINTRIRSKDFTLVKPNTKYTISWETTKNARLVVIEYATNTSSSQQITRTPSQYASSPYTFTTTSTTNYIKLYIISTGDTSTSVSDISNIMLNTGETASTYEAYNGSTYNIDLPVENLFNFTSITDTSSVATLDNGIIKMTWTAGFSVLLNDQVSNLNASKTYTISFKHKGDALYLRNTAVSETDLLETAVDSDYTLYSLTLTNITDFKYKFIRKTTSGTAYVKDFQVEEGSKANSYTPYGTTPIEICKIGDYQDYFYKEDDKWYLHKEIGKVVLDGSENYYIYSVDDNIERFQARTLNDLAIPQTEYYSNYFKYLGTGAEKNETGISSGSSTTNSRCFIFINKTIASTEEQFQTWLSTHNTSVYYILETPTNTEITYAPLIAQLDTINEAQSKEGITNIIQVNNDLPFIIKSTAFIDTYNGRYESNKSDSFEWKLLGKTTGNNTITPPSKYCEIIAIVEYDIYSFSFNIPRNHIKSSLKRFYNGCYFYGSTDAGVEITLSESYFNTSWFEVVGVDKLNQSTTYWYYR